jgi:predicted secreted hydrolase
VVARFPTPEQLMLFRVRKKDSTGYFTGTWNDREGQPKPCTTPLSITEAVNPKA